MRKYNLPGSYIKSNHSRAVKELNKENEKDDKPVLPLIMFIIMVVVGIVLWVIKS